MHFEIFWSLVLAFLLVCCAHFIEGKKEFCMKQCYKTRKWSHFVYLFIYFGISLLYLMFTIILSNSLCCFFFLFFSFFNFLVVLVVCCSHFIERKKEFCMAQLHKTRKWSHFLCLFVYFGVSLIFLMFLTILIKALGWFSCL